jgi:DNA-binding NarL/FixJ family response regulator
LADDMNDLRYLLRLSLETQGSFEVVGEASNGREAVQMAELHQPDVILLDVAMPVMDGLEAIPQIRELSPSTKIVMLTGFSTPALARKALDLGADLYLQKSVALVDLSTSLMDVCAA